MEQQSSTSTVIVEYFDPHDVFKLLAPGLVPRLPLRNLHWQSHSGPLRSIDTLHVELVDGGKDSLKPTPTPTPRQSASSNPQDDGFQTHNIGGSNEATESSSSLASKTTGGQRRHQIPGLRRSPYLKVLLVRCDDNDTYKNSVRAEVKEWVKTHTPSTGSSKKAPAQESHDVFEWIIIHVVIPNTVASTQPRSSHTKAEGGNAEKSATSRWRTSTPLMEKLKSDFSSATKGAPERIVQIRIGINDVPYDLLPRVVPAVPTGYSETEQDAENAWSDLISKLKSLILSSFDIRVTRYEEDIREKDSQRSLPGWNFCTFFILKEGLAQGFENVGLVEDALVVYDELNVGLDTVVKEQLNTDSPEKHGGSLLSYTEDLRAFAEAALASVSEDGVDEETVDMQANEQQSKGASVDEIIISSTKKAYRDLIVENKVSVFDFRCYIFSRQIALLLRLGNASASKEELLAKLKHQRDAILHGEAPLAPPPPNDKDEPENLAIFAEICHRTLSFIPSASEILRRDVISALRGHSTPTNSKTPNRLLQETVDNMAASFAFSVAQQILAQTSSKALPIPPSTLSSADGKEQKSSIPEPKTMMHPARTSSLAIRGNNLPRPPPSPGVFPGPGRQFPIDQQATTSFLKAGIEDLAARRAELYLLSRSVLVGLAKKRGWSDGWDDAPLVGNTGLDDMDEINLDDDNNGEGKDDNQEDRDEDSGNKSGSDFSSASLDEKKVQDIQYSPSIQGIDSQILRTATGASDDFYRLYEILTDKAMRHYTVANHYHAVHSSKADLAVLKVHVEDYEAAAEYFSSTTPFFGENGWNLLELSMLVMYAQCLDKMNAHGDYVNVALKLLTKVSAAMREWQNEKSRILPSDSKMISDTSIFNGVIERLHGLLKGVSSEVKVPLANFFTSIELAGTPEYHPNQDGCSLTIRLTSLLPENITFDSAKLRMVSIDGGPGKERIFEKRGEASITFVPGNNSLQLECKSVVAGTYKIDHLSLASTNLLLHFERDIQTPTSRTTSIFKQPEVVLFQRENTFDISLSASKDTSLDKNNSLDLVICSGWNSIKSCEVRVKPATGGLRFLTNDASFDDSSLTFAKPPEAGVFFFNEIAAESSVKLRFPYSIEQDVSDVFAKLEATYITQDEQTFSITKSLTIPISLALGVNVQDVFKHSFLFSRFNVSTAHSTPLRLYDSELLSTDLFQSEAGIPLTTTVTVFPKQPASLLYRVTRKPGSVPTKTSNKTMHLKLHYTVLEVEIEELIRKSLTEALETTAVKEYSRLVTSCVIQEFRTRVQPRDLERAALLGEASIAYLQDVAWDKHFNRLGRLQGSEEDTQTQLTSMLEAWLKKNARIKIPMSSVIEPCSIFIPVDIPSLSVVHTADIRLQPPEPNPLDGLDGGSTVVCANQLVPATLHLKWTRIWDTESQQSSDQEFSYEVSAPADTWLLGGRRKGHFVIPGLPASAPTEELSSTAETEAEIPLLMIPLREGWLPYPTVEIREIVTADGGDHSQAGVQSCEVDLKNLGETVRVVGNRSGVTVSLDASGPGGGPLVFESEEIAGFSGRIVA